MAGTWIIMKHDLPTCPEVKRITRATGADSVALTVGRLFLVWTWADTHTEDGRVVAELADIDDEAGCDGFGEAMVSAGWLVVDGDAIIFPKFGDLNGMTAKTRAKESLKKQRQRRSKGTQRGHVSPPCPDAPGQTGDHTAQHITGQDKTKPTTRENPETVRAAGAGPGVKSAEKFDWSTVPDSMNTTAVRDALRDWYAYRRESGLRKWKNITLTKTLNKYAKAGGVVALIAAVEHSISQGYQGLVDPKSRGSPKPRVNDELSIKPDDPDDNPLAHLRRENERNAG